MRSWIASIASTTSAGSLTSTASMFSLSCANVVAPIMVDATNQRVYHQASAICAGVMPLARASSAYSFTAASTLIRK